MPIPGKIFEDYKASRYLCVGVTHENVLYAINISLASDIPCEF